VDCKNGGLQMPRKVKDCIIDTRTARAKLKPQGLPYWRSVGEQGLHLGYRRNVAQAGTWNFRILNTRGAKSKYTTGLLGIADDVSEADGTRVLDYQMAVVAARVKATEAAKVANGETAKPKGPFTVSDAIENYLTDLTHRGKDARDARYKLLAHVAPKLGGRMLAGITKTELRAWLHNLSKAPARVRSAKGEAPAHRVAPQGDEQERRRKNSANRVWKLAKATFNHAYAEGHVASDEGWRTVKRLEDADAARVRFLSEDECRRLLNACAPDFRRIVTGALLTGARYSELCRMEVQDFQHKSGTVHINKGKTGARHVHLTAEGVKFFDSLTIGKAAGDLLFAKDRDGSAWGTSHQIPHMAAAAKRAHLAHVNFHALRHSFASHLMEQAEVPLMVIALALGHKDTTMVQKHYGHLRPDFVAETIRAKAMKLGLKLDNKVRTLRA
jgi:integrase